MRIITEAIRWQIPTVQFLETKGVKLETGRKWHIYSPVVI
jgi:hypothetical protein